MVGEKDKSSDDGEDTCWMAENGSLNSSPPKIVGATATSSCLSSADSRALAFAASPVSNMRCARLMSTSFDIDSNISFCLSMSSAIVAHTSKLVAYKHRRRVALEGRVPLVIGA